MGCGLSDKEGEHDPENSLNQAVIVGALHLCIPRELGCLTHEEENSNR